MVESGIKQYNPNPLLTITFMYSVPTRDKVYSIHFSIITFVGSYMSVMFSSNTQVPAKNIAGGSNIDNREWL